MSTMFECRWCKKLFNKDKLHAVFYYDLKNTLNTVLFCKHCKDEIAGFLPQAKSSNIINIINIIKKVYNEV